MADNPNMCFSRSKNSTRGRDPQREACFGSRPSIHFQDYVGDETITIRNSNLSPRNNNRMSTNRNRISSSRNRFERMHRRSDSFNRQFHQSPVNNHEVNQEHTQDNIENSCKVENDSTETSTTKTNNNITITLNLNSVMNTKDCVDVPQKEGAHKTNDLSVPKAKESSIKCKNIDGSVFYLPKPECLSPSRAVTYSKELNQRPPESSDPTKSSSEATTSSFNSASAPSTSSKPYASTGAYPRAITKKNENWINAPEFHPKSYSKTRAEPKNEVTNEQPEKTICPVTQKAGVCRLLPYCPYLHGEPCDICRCNVLHPTDEEQRKRHRQRCLERQDRDVEMATAINRSREKTCGICFEVVVEKDSDRRFGIMSQCNHCFCLSCIRKWRQARQFEHNVVKACPECRVTSDFVCPSHYWVETKEDKQKLIESYMKVLGQKACKYFRQGRGVCPFGNKCFYLHALPDGSKADVGPPPRRRPNRPRNDRFMGLDLDVLQMVMWDLNNEFENQWTYNYPDSIDGLPGLFSDSDDSDMADYECAFQ